MNFVNIFIICLLIFFSWGISCDCVAQDISVYLTIEWSKKIDNESNKLQSRYKFDSIPELVISYQNNSERDLYMLKAMEAENYFPYLGIEWFKGELLSSNLIESKQPLFSCIVRKLTPDKWVIAGIHCLMDQDHKSNEKAEQFYNKTMHFTLFDSKNSYMFFPNDLTFSAIKKNDNSDFLFIRKKSNYDLRFSLLGFYLLGGEFRFSLYKDMFRGAIFSHPQSFDTRRKRKVGAVTFDGMTIMLPDVISDSYLLFIGKCISDSVFIHFTPPPYR